MLRLGILQPHEKRYSGLLTKHLICAVSKKITFAGESLDLIQDIDAYKPLKGIIGY
jgi:hypothetical protein